MLILNLYYSLFAPELKDYTDMGTQSLTEVCVATPNICVIIFAHRVYLSSLNSAVATGLLLEATLEH